MHWRGWLISAIATAGAVHATASLAQSPIGSAASVQNQVHGTIGGGTQPIAAGNSVFQNERVRTGDASQAQLVFLDQTNLDVGPKSEVTLNRFVYNPDRGTGRVAIEASRGVFRFVSGSQDKKNYEVSTPIATIQVKGTEFQLLVEQEHIVVALVRGALRIVTVRGRVVSHDQPGTTVTIYADGRVDGPMRFTGPFTKYAGDVPFPYFASKPAQASLTLRPAGSLSRPPPRYSWTGFYIGGNIGYSWGRSDTTVTLTDPGPPATTLATANSSFNLNGPIGGGQIGYKWQTGKLVFGIEADLQATGQRGSTSTVSDVPACIPCEDPPVTTTLSERLIWLDTLRGSVGWTVTPTVLIYVTGGLAVGGLSANGTISGINGVTPVVGYFSSSSTNTGGTIGGGLEAALGGHWTGKIEYLYVDLGTFSGGPFVTPILAPSGSFLTGSFSSHVTDNILRVGVNFRFF
jgi:outer membrane immunogenic protein